jgi:hypothetical protein
MYIGKVLNVHLSGTGDFCLKCFEFLQKAYAEFRQTVTELEKFFFLKASGFKNRHNYWYDAPAASISKLTVDYAKIFMAVP